MEILSIAVLALLLVGIASAWFRFRSNWRSIQEMRSENLKAPVEPGFDVPEGSAGLEHHGHGHDCAHHGADAGDHGWFDGGGHHH